MTIDLVDCAKINCPELFSSPEFAAWLNSHVGKGLATWHAGGEPHDFSDVFVIYDWDDEAPADDMPDDAWQLLSAECKRLGLRHAVLWLTNVE